MKLGFKATIILVLALLAQGGVGLFIVYQAISSGEKEVLNLQEKLLVIDDKKKNIAAMKKFSANIKNDAEKINGAFLTENRIIEFIETLEEVNLAANAEIEIQSALLSENQESSPVFDFKLTGSFENLFRALSLIENLPYQIEIGELKFIKEGKEGKWQAKFKIEVLSFLPSE